jgi:hypothetical protein
MEGSGCGLFEGTILDSPAGGGGGGGIIKTRKNTKKKSGREEIQFN